jgi:hypothetical protein
MDYESSSSSEVLPDLPDQAVANYRAVEYGGGPVPCKMGVYYGNCGPSHGNTDDRGLIDG